MVSGFAITNKNVLTLGNKIFHQVVEEMKLSETFRKGQQVSEEVRNKIIIAFTVTQYSGSQEIGKLYNTSLSCGCNIFDLVW